MTNEAIEAAALAMANVDCRRFDCPELGSANEFRYEDDYRDYIERARAAAPALMEEGARLALAAAAEAVLGYIHPDHGRLPGAPFAVTQVRTLDPAAIVKGAGHDRD